MSIIASIFAGIKIEHAKTDNKEFILRYKRKEVCLLDHYRHLKQLLPLYELMEIRMKSKEFPFKIPKEFCLQSAKIREDLDFLKPHIPASQRTAVVLSSTQEYLKLLNNCGDEEFFGHYLTRILGDLFGGQTIKNYVKEMYKTGCISSEEKTEKNGFNFYSFEKHALMRFSHWLSEQVVVNIDNIVNSANLALVEHQIIFDELEETRVINSKVNCCSRFFSLKNIVAATTVVVLTSVAYTM